MTPYDPDLHDPPVELVEEWLAVAVDPEENNREVPPEVEAQFPHQGWTRPGRSSYICLMEAYLRLKREEVTRCGR